jgi:hypothetical protein
MKLNEVYRDSGLGKWFHKQSATKEPGWDRYNSSGKRVGKCGDAKEGESYSACLSKQKAQKLGKEGVSSFVKRKRSAQKEAGRGKKGTGAKGKKPIFVETGAAKKKKVNEHMENVNESCGCENKEKSLMGKIKQKMNKKILKETHSFGVSNNSEKFGVRINNKKGNAVVVRFDEVNEQIKPWKGSNPANHVTKECMDFTELDLAPFRGKKVLIETTNGDWYGTLGIIKNNFALLNGEEIVKTIDPSEVSKVICENARVLILEKNKPNDPEKWSACKSAAKQKFDVYPSAYANAWASKCYKKKGGSWRKVNEELDTTIFNESKAIKSEADPILHERLRDFFFNREISEEIVNKDNKGKLTKDRQASRDKIEKSLKNVKVVKGPPGRKDTPEEARYRLATYIELKKGKKKD